MQYHVDMESRESLSDVRDVLLAKDKDMRYCSAIMFFKSINQAFGRKVTDSVHKWYDMSMRLFSITSGTSGSGLLWDSTSATTGLTINSSYTAKLRVGHVLRLPTGGEIVIVKSINTGANTIDVYARGEGSSSGTAQGTSAFTIEIVGHADIEGGAPGEAYFQGGSLKTNYVQTFEDVITTSREAQLSKWFDGGSYVDGVLAIKMKEMLRLLNRTLWYGLAQNDTTNKIKMMGGLREFSAVSSNVGGALTDALLYTALELHLAAGLVPDAIHGSIHAIGVLERLYKAGLMTRPSESVAGQSVSVIKVMGYDIELHADRDLPSSEMFIVDYSRIGFGPLEGNGDGSFGLFDVYNDGKRVGKQIAGYYTAQIMNGGSTRVYGIS